MQVKRKFFDELVKQELILAWAIKNDIEDTAEFKKSFAEMVKLVKRSLLVQQFESQIFKDIVVTDADVKKHFDENKEKFIKEPGGVLVSGIKFKNAEKADAFLEKAKANKSDFVELAKEEDSTNFQDFGRVSEQPQQPQQPMGQGSDVPSAIQKKALELKTLPAIAKVKVGKNIWVIHVSDKKTPEYFKLDEIKPQLETMLKNNKFREVLDGKIKTLRGEFTIDVNEDFFKETKVGLPEGMKIKTREEVEAEKSEQDVENGSASTAV